MRVFHENPNHEHMGTGQLVPKSTRILVNSYPFLVKDNQVLFIIW